MARKRKRSELKAFKYSTVMKQYADVFAPAVALTDRYIRAREELYRSVANQVRVPIPGTVLRQMFMTSYSLLRKRILDREVHERVLKNKYPHVTADQLEAFLDAFFGSRGALTAT
ncbi:MAG: hypothetical protein QXS16_05380 [Pyrobaculum sp.]